MCACIPTRTRWSMWLLLYYHQPVQLGVRLLCCYFFNLTNHCSTYLRTSDCCITTYIRLQ